MLKMTKIELELISDSDIYLFLMDTIRGGMTVCNKKFVKADNIYTRKKDENSDINKYLMYLDANNLYVLSMSKPLPYENFKWSNVIPSEVSLNENNLKTGIYEVDIKIPENLLNKFKDFPLCPEIKSINENNLSEYQKYLNDKLDIKYNEKDKELILDLSPKKNYRAYYKNLEYYLRLGIKVTKVHKILTFDGKPFLKEYIDLDTNLLKPWGSNKQKTIFNKYTGPGNPIHSQVDFHPYTGQIYKVNDPPSSNNDRCSMFHDIKYTAAENIGRDSKDIKSKKLEADKEWLNCFKPRSPWDIAAYTAIKSKKTLGLGVENNSKILSKELDKPKRKNCLRRKVIVNHIDEMFAADLVEMQNFNKMNKGYRYLLTCVDIFSKYAFVIPLKDKKGITIKNALQKFLKKENLNGLIVEKIFIIIK